MKSPGWQVLLGYAVALVIVLVVIAALSGCASEAPIVTTPVEVKVPVVVPCQPKPVEEPKWATDQLTAEEIADPSPAGAFVRARAVVEELAQRMGYEIELKAALAGCAGVKAN